ncbi:MAG: Ldh family oxidoreductase [Proteobacteria bacterium]|nr:Ldh family oxidoreductase [Pseudomonadota bacterium]
MKVTPGLLKRVAISILKELNATDEEAAVVAENLVRANMRGIDTHGVNYLKLLSERVGAHLMDIPTNIRLIREDDTTALLDGGNGFGQVAAHRAMRISIRKGRDFGIGLTLVRNTNNIGFLSFYTLIAAAEGMTGICACNAAASMAPWGGSEPFLGTNPLSIAVPNDSEAPVVLDMSASVVARGKIRRAQRLKEEIPIGWALDEKGQPTTDPSAALKGTLLPIGGPKGYGLALIIDLLAGMLSGSKYGKEVETFHQLRGPTGIGVLTMAIDIERFMPLNRFRELMASYVESIKRTKKAKGGSQIYLPGEIEFEKEKRSEAEGIEIDTVVAESLNDILNKMKSPLKLTGE